MEFPGSIEVELKNVCFERADVGLVLDQVDLKLSANKFYAIVGPSGAGKSTLIDMILRLADPKSGQVLVNGQNLRDLHRPSFVRHVGTVTQETFIFGGTLADNLLIAQPLAEDDQMWRVLESVELSDWVRSLPDQLDQDLEGGIGLSAGQKQRIGIARALMCNPKILILDEPTSALDSETEESIMATLISLAAKRTVILVTHRINTVANADHITVMERGKIVEQGRFDELIAKKGLFAEMVWLHRATTAESMAVKEAQLK